MLEAGVLAEVVPVAGAALGVDIEEDGSVPGLFGERAGEGGSCRSCLSARALRVQEASNTPLQMNMGIITTTFMMPETPRWCGARLAVSSPRPPNASAPISATTRVARPPSFPTPKTQTANPRSASISRPRNASREMTIDARKCERRIGVATIRSAACQPRHHDAEPDSPHARAHDVHAQQARHEPVDVVAAGASRPPRAGPSRARASGRAWPPEGLAWCLAP